MSGTKKLCIIGPIPQPSGGVADFLSRLVLSGDVDVELVVDPYHSNHKINIPAPHVFPKSQSVLSRLQVLLAVRKSAKSPLLVNGSTIDAALAAGVLLRYHLAPKMLLLHHGDLFSSRYPIRRLRLPARAILSTFDVVACMSESQIEFYRYIGLEASKLWLVDPYIRPQDSCQSGVPSAKLDEVLGWVQEGKNEYPLIVGSGYARAFYNHEWPLEYVQTQQKEGRIRYLLCCYGPIDQYFDRLKDKFAGLANAKIVYGLQSHEFLDVLRQADIYVRPTSVDSFGIATRDALEIGKVVVASDACQRSDGTLVHRVGDKADFFNKLRIAVSSRPHALARVSTSSEPVSNKPPKPIVSALRDFISQRV